VLTGHEKMQEAGLLTVKAVVESYVVSHILLKTLVARHRPARPLGDMVKLIGTANIPLYIVL
jgi:hypothetical protein